MLIGAQEAFFITEQFKRTAFIWNGNFL